MINIEATCPNISFVEDKNTPLLNQLTFFADDGLKEFDTSEYVIDGLMFNCKLSSVTFRARQKEYAKLDTSELEQSFTSPFDEEDLFIYENGKLTIDTDEAEPGDLTFLLMFKQRNNNTAFIEFEITFEEKPEEEPAVVFQVIIEEEE